MGQLARHAVVQLWLVTLLAAVGCKDDAADPKLSSTSDDAGATGGMSDSGVRDVDGGAVDAGTSGADAAAEPDAIDLALAELIEDRGLTGDPAAPRGLKQTRPADDALVRLGQLLFFSQTLAANFDSSCGTCHHPDLGASDGLSLSVGVGPYARWIVGPGRAVDPTRDRDPLADDGPNMPRNSTTTYNIAIFDRMTFFDGRVHVLDENTEIGGHGQAIRTPESGLGADPTGASGMLEVMTKLPLMSDNEMRAFSYTDLSNPDQYRDRILQRLRGEAEQDILASNGPKRWLSRFREAFDAPSDDADTLITVPNMQRALAAYIASQIFVDTPWRDYVRGDTDALDEDEKRGALLFLQTQKQGGLGCASCHGGDGFTDERFFNTGFPQIGRGFRLSDRRDLGRWLVTREATAWFAFRVPMLLNVALTAPYGHAGTFDTLEDLVRYHANPREAVDDFDFSLTKLKQFEDPPVSYPEAEAHTRDAIAHATFSTAEALLPKRDLSDDEVRQLVAFLGALTDRCADDDACRSAWTPDAALDPDGHMLVRDAVSPAPSVDTLTPADYPTAFDLTFSPQTPRTTFPDVEGCTDSLATATNTGSRSFVDHTGSEAFGLTAAHGFDNATWMAGGNTFEPVMMAGGASSAYLDDDCWPDIVYAGGDASGLVLYRNLGGQLGFAEEAAWVSSELRTAIGTRLSGVAIADLNGDYRRELVLGNVVSPEVPILSRADDGTFYEITALSMSRHTFGISFGLFGDTGYPSLYLAHWSGNGVPGTAPAFFFNDGGTRLLPYDDEAGTSSAYVDQSFNFTPLFGDMNRSGAQDLLLASDFGTSQLLRNETGDGYTNVTDEAVITDENGMGSVLLDYDNDGRMDWFVSSIFEPGGTSYGNWGGTGNRLYRNVSKAGGALKVADVTTDAGVRDGNWGWGACAADFDLDGFIDLFHVNGFGYFPAGVLPTGGESAKAFFEAATEPFVGTPPRLFMNDGDGTFTEQASAWGIAVPSEGRGVACFDSDRDGDVDVLVFDHSSGLQFFENQIGHGSDHRFLNVRVLAGSPNTDALGARVTVTANVGHGHGTQIQTRVVNANSHFNSQDVPDVIFGLGTAVSATTLTVSWPGDPVTLTCSDVATNRFLVFDQRDKQCP